MPMGFQLTSKLCCESDEELFKAPPIYVIDSTENFRKLSAQTNPKERQIFYL